MTTRIPTRIPCFATALSLILAFPMSGVAAQSATAILDPQAVAILTQAVTAAEGAQALVSPPIQDFTASGTIIYYWAGEQVQGTATVRGRGTAQFRLDANLPAGTRTHAISYGGGAVKDTSGVITPIPYHDTVNVGVLSFPYLAIAADLTDPTVLASYAGLVDNGAGGQFQQVHVQHQSLDPSDILASLRVTDYFVDPLTNLVAKTVDSGSSLYRSLLHITSFFLGFPYFCVRIPFNQDLRELAMAYGPGDIFEQITSLQSLDGSMAKFINDPAVYDDLKKTVDQANTIMAKVNEGQGSLGKMMDDPQLYNRMNSTVAHVDSITARMDSGQGSRHPAPGQRRGESLLGDLLPGQNPDSRLVEA